jgi:aspartyl-tRNA(Asn)/glutamyl-tRNA(Gln) amidotransferase subunit A
MPDLHQHSLLEVAAMLRRGDVTAVELTRHALARIETYDSKLHTFITVDADGALRAAERAERQRQAGVDLGPLQGVPIAVKDNLATAGLVTTYNSRAMADATPATDAPADARLRAAGAVIIGKTNLNEFGWSLPSDADLAPPVRNPWQPKFASIGSSSGSAAAVAAGFAYAALGTDGGGSTRLPAGQHAQVGLKPTRGAVAHIARSSDLSVIGVLARCAEDAAAVFDAIATAPTPPAPPSPVDGLRLGIPRHYIDQVGIEDDVRASFEDSVATLRALGVSLTEVELPTLDAARAATFVLISAGAFSDWESLLRDRIDLLGPVTQRYLLTGAFVSGADVLRAQRVRALIESDLRARLAGLDGVLTPVTPFVTSEAARHPSQHRRGRNAAFTSPFNLIGWPGIAIPAHIASCGLPVGFQVAALPHSERMLLALAHAYGSATGRHGMLAPLGS